MLLLDKGMALMGITAINTLPQQSTDKLMSSERFFGFVAPASDFTDTHTLLGER